MNSTPTRTNKQPTTSRDRTGKEAFVVLKEYTEAVQHSTREIENFVTVLEGANMDLKEQNKQIAPLEHEVKKLQKEVSKLKDENALLQGQLSLQQNIHMQLEQQDDQLNEGRIKKLEIECDNLKKELDESQLCLNKNKETFDLKIEDIELQLTEKNEENKTITQARDKINEEVCCLKKLLESKENDITEQNTEIEKLKKTITTNITTHKSPPAVELPTEDTVDSSGSLERGFTEPTGERDQNRDVMQRQVEQLHMDKSTLEEQNRILREKLERRRSPTRQNLDVSRLSTSQGRPMTSVDRQDDSRSMVIINQGVYPPREEENVAVQSLPAQRPNTSHYSGRRYSGAGRSPSPSRHNQNSTQLPSIMSIESNQRTARPLVIQQRPDTRSSRR